MDIATSHLSLHVPGKKKDINLRKKSIKQLVASFQSLSTYESSSFRSLLPQIIATVIAASFHIGNGISLSYSSVVIDQLARNNSDFHSSESENAWIASVLSMVIPFCSIICGILMDSIGRINTIKLACLPGVVGWCTIALAQNVPTIIVGRILLGTSMVLGSNPAMVYITEISSSNIRMSLLCVASVFSSLGMVIGYSSGWVFTWRIEAWISNIFIIVPIVCCLFIYESPDWLMLRGKEEQAMVSLNWLNKNQPQPTDRKETLAEMHFQLLKDDQQKKHESGSKMDISAILKEFLKPTGYRPFIITFGLSFFHHFTGVYVTLYYSITFIQEAGTNMNAYLASILIGFVRLVMSVASIYLLKNFRRRTLFFISGIGMCFCMFIAGLYTSWIKEGVTTMKAVPAIALLFYVVFSTIAFLFLPIMIMAELYPLEIRGVAYSVSQSINCAFMFAALQSYYYLIHLLGGISNLQYFYSVMSLAGTVYVYIFLPETKGLKLNDVSVYFKEGWLYIGRKQ